MVRAILDTQDLASIVFNNVPVVQESNTREGTPALIADISNGGLWQPQTVYSIARCACCGH